jgi:hypothetical protein
MHATHFVLICRFRLHTDADAVWRLLIDVERWPQWWRNVRRARLASGWRGSTETAPAAPEVHAADIDWHISFAVGLQLRFASTYLQTPYLLEAHVTGDLRGSVLWLVEPVPSGDAVDVTCRFEVDVCRPWMRRLIWLVRWTIAWGYFKLMHAGAWGMARRLGCKLSEVSDWSGGPS